MKDRALLKITKFADADGLFSTDIYNLVLCWLAVVSPNAISNATPNEIFARYGDKNITVADNMSANSVKNIRPNPNICLSFVGVFGERGFNVVDVASIISRNSPDFRIVGAELLSKAGDFEIPNIIMIDVHSISRIWAKVYILFPNRSEADRLQTAYVAYVVSPVVAN